MWTWKTWKRSRSSARPLTAGVTGRRSLAWGLALLLLACLVALPVQAEAGVQVLSREHAYRFSESLSFSLKARSDSPVVEVILFYGLQDSPLVRRIYPDFRPGKEISVEYVEELEQGQFAPGITLRYWWRLQTEAGDVVNTQVETFQYLDDRFDWQTLAGERVDLFWYGRDGKQARALLSKADEVVAKLEQDIGVVVERRPQVYVYNSSKDMALALMPRSAGYDDRVTTLGVSVGEDTLLLLGSHSDAEMVVAHELSHVVVGIATRNPYADLPRWLDEGLAMHAEGELPRDNRLALEAAIRKDALLSIRSMTSYSGQASQVDLFYGEAYSLVNFMLEEFGRAKMQALLAVFAEGARQEQALQQVYGMGVDQLENLWRASLGLGPRSANPEVPAQARLSQWLTAWLPPSPQPLFQNMFVAIAEGFAH